MKKILSSLFAGSTTVRNNSVFNRATLTRRRAASPVLEVCDSRLLMTAAPIAASVKHVAQVHQVQKHVTPTPKHVAPTPKPHKVVAAPNAHKIEPAKPVVTTPSQLPTTAVATATQTFLPPEVLVINGVSYDIKIGADLRNADLHGADLSNRDLTGTDFSGANLHGAKLNGSDLSGANFKGCNLYRASLIQANLTGADLSDSNCIDIDLSGANLTSADASHADFDSARFVGCNLTDTNLSFANLSNAAFYGPTTMIRTDMRNANLMRANFASVRFIQANLDGVDASFAKFDYAFLESMTARDAKFTFASFDNSEKYYSKKNTQPVNFKGSDTFGSTWKGARTRYIE